MNLIPILLLGTSSLCCSFDINNYKFGKSTDAWNLRLAIYRFENGSRNIINFYLIRDVKNIDHVIKVFCWVSTSNNLMRGSNGSFECKEGPNLNGILDGNAFKITYNSGVSNSDSEVNYLNFDEKRGSLVFKNGVIYKYRIMDEIDSYKFDEFYKK